MYRLYMQMHGTVNGKMKPEQWIIDDIRSMRQKKERTEVEESYLSLLLWYVKVLQDKE